MTTAELKNFIKKILPNSWQTNYKRYKKAKYHKEIFAGLHTTEIFSKIHNENFWGSSESISGSGSEINQTLQLINSLPNIFKDYKIKTILDIPCGDFNWMKNIDFSNLEYVGADIVKTIVDNNNLKYKKENVKFIELDLTKSKLPEVDMVLCRDCWVHLSNDLIVKAINNIIRSESKYLLATSYFDKKNNYDIVTGDWRPLNLQMPPFNFPNPIEIIIENCTEMNGFQYDKSLMLWEIKNIKCQG